MTQWALLSGEFPPAQGGVADYTAQVAVALAAAGDEVHVFAPGPLAAADGVQLHPLPGCYGWRARRRLGRELASLAEAQWLVQYVPHAFGHKAMNLGFTRWLARRRGVHPWVMFHEVAVPYAEARRARHRLLGWVTQRMAGQVQRAAARSLVSTPTWAAWLQRLAPGSVGSVWMPVPSNLPTRAEPAAVAAVRAQVGAPAGKLLGCFNRYNDYTCTRLQPVLTALLARDRERHALLAGPGGERLAAAIAATAPGLRPQLHASGHLEPDSAAAHLAAADLLLQPYPDGLTARRGTAMAGLALGRPLLSEAGAATEALWQAADAVALVAAAAPPSELTAAAEALLADAERRQQLGEAGRRLYEEHFALAHTVRWLRAAAAEGRPRP